MSTWTKESALQELQALLEWIPRLKSEKRFSAEHMHWYIRSETYLSQVFGTQSIYYKSFCRLSWSYVGWVQANPVARAAAHQSVYVEQLESALGLMRAAQDELQRSDLEAVFRGQKSGQEASLLLQIMSLAEQKLRKVIREPPIRERQVQDAFENLLIGADIAYSRELGGIEYSSKTYTPDFVVTTADLVIEFKLCKDGNEKSLIGQINDDILAYGTKYENLLFLVYDVGQIQDVDRFSASFETERVLVRVIKH